MCKIATRASVLARSLEASIEASIDRTQIGPDRGAATSTLSFGAELWRTAATMVRPAFTR
jgi:hypothetical protein